MNQRGSGIRGGGRGRGESYGDEAPAGRGAPGGRGGAVGDPGERGRGGFHSLERGRGGLQAMAPRGRGFVGRGLRGAPRGGRGGGLERGGFESGRGGRGRGREDAPVGPVKTKLHVRNIKEDVTPAELQKLFSSVGEVVECDIVKDFAFVHFASAEEANRAIEELDGSDLHGQAIEIKVSRSNLRQQPGMKKDQCFRCGSREHWSNDCPHDRQRTEAGSREGPIRGQAGGPEHQHPYTKPDTSRSPFPPYDPERRDPYYRRMRLKKLELAYRRAVLEARAEELGMEPYTEEFFEEMFGEEYADPLREPLRDPLGPGGILDPSRDTIRTEPKGGTDASHVNPDSGRGALPRDSYIENSWLAV